VKLIPQQKIHPLFLSLLSGLLLFAAWPMSPFTFLIFFAFIPLLHLSEIKMGRWKYFLCIYIAMLIWNVATTWWIWYASPEGAISAFLTNSLLMCVPWLLFRRVKRKLNKPLSYIALISFWMTFEFLHLQDWGLSWPWLTLGNVFADKINWIQWYEYTGVSGGTLWVLIVNTILYQLLKNWNHTIVNAKQKIIKVVIVFVAIVIPLLASFIVLLKYSLDDAMELKYKPKRNLIAIIQPNIDPYIKLSDGTFASQLNTLLVSSKKIVDSNTKLLIWPETALYNEFRFNEDDINDNHAIDTVFNFLKQYPKLNLFTGIESYKYFKEPTVTTRTFPNTNIHFESYNSSVLLNYQGATQFYHKSMLVPGVETLPFFLSFMGKWFEDFGGTTNGYVKSEERTVIDVKQPTKSSTIIKIAPSICYESIYGGFMSEYVNNGANLITIITNDGWWRNTPGHKQHMSYARLRAIENRQWVARSANTGISCFINQFGKVLQSQPYNTQATIEQDIILRDYKTFYTKNPDLLYKIFYVIAMLMLLLFVVKYIKR
jgi:apolipoprotein N-acyltransferase